MALESLSRLSLNELISTLHDLVRSFGRGIDKLIKENDELSVSDIDELRDHISARMGSGAESADSSRLLKLITLFKEDKKALGLIREDVDEWLGFLENIEKHISKDSGDAGKKEAAEIGKLKESLAGLKETLRQE